VADRVAATSAEASHPGVVVREIPPTDPRVPPDERSHAAINFEDPGSADHVERLTGWIARLAAAGIAGFRCLNPHRVPVEVWSLLMAAAREAERRCAFLAWTPGLDFRDRAHLSSAPFDAAFSSIRWWDGREGWLSEEAEAQRRFPAVVGFPEAPFDHHRRAGALESEEVLCRQGTRALRLAAGASDGLLVPMGFEFGAREPMHPARASRETFEALRREPHVDLTDEIMDANAFLRRAGSRFAGRVSEVIAGAGAPLTALLRFDGPQPDTAGLARLVLANRDDTRRHAMGIAGFSASLGHFLPFRAVSGAEATLHADSSPSLAPGEVVVLEGKAGAPVKAGDRGGIAAQSAAEAPRLTIDAVKPCVDGGLLPVKRIVGEVVAVEADVIGDGHDPLAVVLRWKAEDEERWSEEAMTPLGNDRWAGSFPVERLGRYHFTIEAWRDEFAIFRYEVSKKHQAGLNLYLELEEGRRLVEKAASRSSPAQATLQTILGELAEAEDERRLEILMAMGTRDAMHEADDRPFRRRHDPIALDAERSVAAFASWYELFPRSQSFDSARHGTFDDVIPRLPWIRAMGFDVLYFPPIHPIGRTNRKGRNNSLNPGPDDPGSPYAIGSEEGGHDAVHPQLGTLEDFQRLVAAAAENGLEIALDFAIQCSPDHPWLKEHPGWFDWRPDGTIKYAENPPKKYEDIVNVDFYGPDAIPELWTALRDVVLFWVGHGVRLFRVDNPHTKPLPFWEWMIREVRAEHPDTVFLAEAFTRPKVMYRLAKIGFSQSYTYFTWRNTKAEITEYLTELATTEPKDFFRPHFFVNTPDINPDFLQNAPRSAFLVRAALATTLSGLWGMYNGFEICEGRPDRTRKEYLDSEKYEIRAWDFDRPGNIVAEISRLNRIRRENAALQSHLGVTFLPAGNDRVLLYEKATAGRENVLLVAVNLDPYAAQEADIELPLWRWKMPDDASLAVEDLMRGHIFGWHGKMQRIRLDPGELPFSIWRVSPPRDR
jgi:starch synthase (maltosyl-transferring)